MCCDIELFFATQFPWLFSVLLQFLSRPNFSLSRHNFIIPQLLLSRQKFLCRDINSAFNSLLCHKMNFFVATPLVLLFHFFVATENSPPSCFGCCDINNICRDRDLIVLGCEYGMLCRDRIFFYFDINSSLSWLDAKNFVAT